jgi:hypothetical protein
MTSLSIKAPKKREERPNPLMAADKRKQELQEIIKLLVA